MGKFHNVSFPGESDAYRQARDVLLAAELELRQRMEDVAAQRRALPAGGAVPEDYVFTEAKSGDELRLSELFTPGKESLALYGFMYKADDEEPCPMCTAFLDGLNGSAPHIGQQTNLAVVAKASPAQLQSWADSRGWHNLHLLSWGGTRYGVDYLAESADGRQQPIMNVFQKQGDNIVHTYGTEVLYAPWEPFQNPRHMDSMFPIWTLLDLTPGGRGEWYPNVAYD